MIDVDVEAEDEVRDVMVMRDPREPTKEEIDRHNITPMPSRAWGAACVAGKARDQAHRCMEDRQSDVHEVVFDYTFMASVDDTETAAMQVAKDRRSRIIFAHVVHVV